MLATTGILRHSQHTHRHAHTLTLTHMPSQGHPAPPRTPWQLRQCKVGGAVPSRHSLPSEVLLQVSGALPPLCRGTSPGFFRGFLPSPFCPHSLFLHLLSFSSVSQRTWALSFSTPEPGVGFYSVDPLQKPRSICLIS